uniref:Homologous recombination OB-fold protein OB-fold domain-containing protein n=1 Tax=Tanacetum cinerariifolium TaxID=118510 RepID=A0A699I488_TANCI|nr:hypothetical protein [Tanacetum cinerariifolium]
MSSIDTYSTTRDLVFDEWVSSHKSDEIRFEVNFDGCFFMCLLKYEDETILDLRDIKKMFKVANLQGTFDLYVCLIPQVFLVEYYFRNLDVVFESDEEVISIYRGHEKIKNDATTMSFQEIVAWEKEELQSPFYLRSSYVWKSNSVGIGKGKVLLDDFEIVVNGKDKVVLDDAKDGLISTKSDEIGGRCFGDIESYLKKGKLKIVVAIITSCKLNVLGDMNVTLKDPLGTTSGTIHYKVLSSEDGYAKDIKVGSALILRNVSVFCDKSKNYALNITIKNLFKINKKDTAVEDADGASSSKI